MEQWEPAEKVQKNESTGEYRALMQGQWVPVQKAQKNDAGEYRVIRLQQQQAQTPQKAPSGYLRGLKDPIDAGAQLATNVLPDFIVNPVNRLNNYLADKTGLVDKIPVGGVDQMVRDDERAYQEQRKAAGETGMDLDRIAGNVLNPVNLAVAAKIPAGVSLIGKLGMATTAGATMGALQPATFESPENFASEKATQMLMGGLFGLGTQAALSSGSWVFQQAKKTGMMATAKGRMQLVKEAIKRWGGKDADDIIRSLDDAQPNPLGANAPKRLDTLPDSPVTAGDAIAAGNVKARQSANPRVFGREILEAQDKLAKQPGVSNDLASDVVKQQVAREKAIASIAKTDAEYKAAELARKTATKGLYDAAAKSKNKVNIKEVNNKVNELLESKGNVDSIASPLQDIKSKLWPNNKPETNVGKLMALSQDIKNKMAKKTPGGQNEFDVSVLTEIRSLLDDAIGNAEKNYKVANRLYKDLSGPLNRMDVGKELANKLTPPTGTEASGTFLRAADDAARTIKKSTGFSRFDKLDDVLTPKEVNTVNRVVKELEREAEKARLLNKTPGMNVAKEAEQGMVAAPRILEQSFVIANYFLGKAKERIVPELNQMAADILRDPQKLKEVLQTVPKDKVGEVLRNMASSAQLARAPIPAATSLMEERKR